MATVLIYKGLRRNAGVGSQLVYKNMSDGHTILLDPKPSQKLYYYSPDFNWGYTGAGPSQLAIALLLDTTSDPEITLKYFKLFMYDEIARFGDAWAMQTDFILTWLEYIKLQLKLKETRRSEYA